MATREKERHTKFIFVTGGVVSSLGKGLSAACIGALLEAQSHFEAALEKYEEALALDKEAGNTPGIAACLHNLGSVHLKLGAPEKAAGYFQRAYYVNSWIGRDDLAAQDLREAEKARTGSK